MTELRENEGCYPCEGCEFFTKAVIKATPWWEITDRIIDVIIPICIRTAHTFALSKCKNYEPSEFAKEMESYKKSTNEIKYVDCIQE